MCRVEQTGANEGTAAWLRAKNEVFSDVQCILCQPEPPCRPTNTQQRQKRCQLVSQNAANLDLSILHYLEHDYLWAWWVQTSRIHTVLVASSFPSSPRSSLVPSSLIFLSCSWTGICAKTNSGWLSSVETHLVLCVKPPSNLCLWCEMFKSTASWTSLCKREEKLPDRVLSQTERLTLFTFLLVCWLHQSRYDWTCTSHGQDLHTSESLTGCFY